MAKLVSDETTIVTGAARGLGREIAKTFAANGSDVVVADVDRGPDDGMPTDQLVSERYDVQCTYVECDVTSIDDIDEALDAADAFSGVTTLVNNAGIIFPVDFFEITPDMYQQTMDVNVRGTFFASQRASKRMMEDNGGSIINISSINGFLGNEKYTDYGAAKAAVRVLTYALADRLGPEGIRVNAVAPGMMDTSMTEDVPDWMIEPYLEAMPDDFEPHPKYVADVVLFLASDLASYINGETITVDGGYTMTG